MLLKVLFWFLLIYGIILIFSGFAKIKWMIKMAKMKLGENATDKKAINLMYISGVALLIASIVVGFFAF